MLALSIILIVAAIIFFGIALYLTAQTHKINHLVDEENIKKERYKEHLEEEIKELERILNLYTKNVEQSQMSFENYCDVLDLSYQIKENEFDAKVRALALELEQKKENDKRDSLDAFRYFWETLEKDYIRIEEDFDKKIALLQKDYNIQEEKLNKIKATYAAAKEAQLREEEIALQSDFYSLHLTQLEQDTITLIEDLKPRLPEPRVLCMLIWSTFYQKQMTGLCNNILGPNIVCGIYKITNKKSGLCYIGQAINIADRWKQHVKCGLGIDTPAQNKLYKAMQKDGITNFTFELLEKCSKAELNEKEKYYISLYQSYDCGYNSTGGNK